MVTYLLACLVGTVGQINGPYAFIGVGAAQGRTVLTRADLAFRSPTAPILGPIKRTIFTVPGSVPSGYGATPTAVSPSGELVAVATATNGKWSVYVCETSPWRLRSQTSIQSFFRMRWSPDGRKLAIQDSANGGAFRLLVLNDPKAGKPKVALDSKGIAAFHWADSQTIIGARWLEKGRAMTMEGTRLRLGPKTSAKPSFVRLDINRGKEFAIARNEAWQKLGGPVPAKYRSDQFWNPFNRDVATGVWSSCLLLEGVRSQPQSGFTRYWDVLVARGKDYSILREQNPEYGLVGARVLEGTTVVYWSWGSIFPDEPKYIENGDGLRVATIDARTGKKSWWLIQGRFEGQDLTVLWR